MTRANKKAHRPAGFTLIELMVVLVIILLLSVAALPTVYSAIVHRQVEEGASLFQATLAAMRDQAIRANEPRGVRLLPDYAFPFVPYMPSVNTVATSYYMMPLASSRIISLEPAPDYSEGLLALLTPSTDFVEGSPLYNASDPRIGVQEVQAFPPPANPPVPAVPNTPTSWFWNIRQGDRIRFGDAGRYYTIAGPMKIGVYDTTGNLLNPERFVNFGLPGPTGFQSGPGGTGPEFLYLVNGQDDDGDGYVDESFDGIDNDGDGVTDPGFNGLDDDGDGNVDNFQELFWSFGTVNTFSIEYEQESFIGPQLNPSTWPFTPAVNNVPPFSSSFVNKGYTIQRRPVPSQTGREVSLPPQVVVDLTTAVPPILPPVSWTGHPERSRVPLDQFTGYVEFMMTPQGQVIQAGASSNPVLSTSASYVLAAPFYHFWLAERQDVYAPKPQSGVPYLLPMPAGTLPTGSYPNASDTSPRFLKGDRRLITIFTRTGQIVSNSIENFNAGVGGIENPYLDVQRGAREEVK